MVINLAELPQFGDKYKIATTEYRVRFNEELWMRIKNGTYRTRLTRNEYIHWVLKSAILDEMVFSNPKCTLYKDRSWKVIFVSPIPSKIYELAEKSGLESTEYLYFILKKQHNMM